MGKRKRNKISEIEGVFDARLSLGPDAPDKSMTALDLVRQCEDETKVGANLHYERALQNEEYFHGFQGKRLRGDQDSLQRTHKAKAYRNYLRNMVQTWASRSQEDRPIIKAFPTHPSGGDYQASKLADAVLQDIHWREEMDQKLWQAAVSAQLHGKVGFKVTWESAKGRHIVVPKLDPETGEQVVDNETGEELEEDLGPQGEIEVKVVSIFEYDYGGAQHAHDADWCIFADYMPEIRAKGILREQLGRGVDHVHVESYVTSMGQKVSGVKVQELWYRPGDLLPKGLYALVIGGHVAVARDFPYDHGMLPLCEWKINPIRNSRFATSHVDDAVQLQSLINDLEEAKVRTVEATGYPRLLALGKIAEAIEEGPHIIRVDSEQEATQGAAYLKPPDPSPLVFDHQGEATQGMYDIFGLNEVLVGKDSVKSGTSAKQIAYLAKLDSMKMSGPTRNLEVAMRRMARMQLSLTRQFVELDRITRLAGPGGELQVLAFRGADLQGYDIHLEPNSGLEKYRSQEQAEAMEELQMGAETPQGYMERKDTGLENTMSKSFDLQKSAKMVAQVLQGGPPVPDQSINPQVALTVIARSMGMNPRFDKALQQLAKFYQQMMMQQQQQQGGAGQPSGGAVGPRQRASMVPNRMGKGHNPQNQEPRRPGINPGGDPSQ